MAKRGIKEKELIEYLDKEGFKEIKPSEKINKWYKKAAKVPYCIFEGIVLQKDEEELLSILIKTTECYEATRNINKEKLQKFLISKLSEKEKYKVFLEHPSLPNGKIETYMGYIETLLHSNLLARSYFKGSQSIEVTNRGFEYYEYIKDLSK